MPDEPKTHYEILRDLANEASTASRNLVDIIGLLSAGTITGTDEPLTDGQKANLVNRSKALYAELQAAVTAIKAEFNKP